MTVTQVGTPESLPMARRVLGFTVLFYVCTIAPFQVGAALAWIVVLSGLVSALVARDSSVALSRVASSRLSPVSGSGFAYRPSGRRGVDPPHSPPRGSDCVGLYLVPRAHRGGASAVGRSLIIVARERPELWRDLMLTYGATDEVEILIDRRVVSHWTEPGTDRDRRSSLRRRTEVTGQGFCVICRT
ncbi:MAG: hypothetical protein H6Q85_2543 [candidate division NC10 bacterium]|nr:hypothetical protein [candidate division NC10 bacterium]